MPQSKSQTQYIYCPAISSDNSIAKQKNAIGKLVTITNRCEVRKAGILVDQRCEISNRVLGWLGNVSQKDLFILRGGKFAPKDKLLFVRRLRSWQIKAKNAKSYNAVIPEPVKLPERTEPEQALYDLELAGIRARNCERISYEAEQVDLMQRILRKNYAAERPLSKRATKTKHKGILPIGNDVAQRHNEVAVSTYRPEPVQDSRLD